MPRVINTFAQENPLAKAISSLGESMFGDTLTPAIKRQQLNDLQRQQLADENFARTLGSAQDGLADLNKLAEYGALGGRKADDTALWNMFLTGNKFGPRDPHTTNAMAGAGKYGDSAENLDLNRAKDIATNRATNDTSRANNTADNVQKMYEWANKPEPALVDGVPGFVKQGQAAQDIAPQSIPELLNFFTSRGESLETSGMDPVFAQRLHAALMAAEQETGEQAQISDLYRSAERQAQYYDAYKAGSGGLAAPPGRSRHQFGQAADIKRGKVRDWMAQNSGRFGIEPLKGPLARMDPVHFQMTRDWNGQLPQQGTPQGAQQRPMIAPIPGKADLNLTQQFQQALDAARVMMPDATPEQWRQLAMQQVLKSKSKGITYTDADGNSFSVGGDDMGGLTTANQTLVQRDSMSFDMFGRTLDMASGLLDKNPNSVGAIGNIRGGIQDAGVIAQSLGQVAGISDIDAGIAEAQQEAQQMGLDPSLFALQYDPSMSQIESVYNILAFQGVRAIGGQTGNDMSNQDFRIIKETLGNPSSWFTNATALKSKMALVKAYVQMRKEQTDKLLGKSAPAAPAPQAPGASAAQGEQWIIGPNGKPARVQ